MPDFTLYGWNKCSTCRTYRAWMQEENMAFEERDFFKEPFTEKELRDLIGKRPVADIFSWNSPSFKAIGVSREEMAANEARMIELMLQEPRLIRRPMVTVGGKLVVGVNKEGLSAATG